MKRSKSNLITLGEGNTPVKLILGIWCKCEQDNPTGSVKDRGLAFSISKLKKSGSTKAVISSSGNAAISAAAYCKLAGISLTVFISPNIQPAKRNKLSNYKCEIVETSTPVSEAVKYAKKNNYYNLRQSTDPWGVYGFAKISKELIMQVPQADAIFIPVSSATTLVGIAQGYDKKSVRPAMHAVQTQKIHPIASIFDKDFHPSLHSIANAIVARVTPRYDEAVKIIQETGGSGWVIEDKYIKDAWYRLSSNGINCSYEGAAAYAAVGKAKANNFVYKNPVVIITGKNYETNQ